MNGQNTLYEWPISKWKDARKLAIREVNLKPNETLLHTHIMINVKKTVSILDLDVCWKESA